MFINTIKKSEKNNIKRTVDMDWLEGTATFIEIPAGEQTTLSAYALNDLPELKDVYIPANITTIPQTAFTNCPKLSSIVIARKSTTALEKNAPWGAPSTCTVTFDPSAKPKHAKNIVLSIDVPDTTTTPTPTSYRQAMKSLLNDIRVYLNKTNHPGFQMINNGGIDIFAINEEKNWTEKDVKETYSIVNAVMVEDVFYGTDKDWNIADDTQTPADITQDFVARMKAAQENGLTILSLDYCTTASKVADSYAQADKNNFTGFAAYTRALTAADNGSIHNENVDNHFNVNTIKNYLVLLNAEKYTDKDSYLSALANTNYDAIIIDLLAYGAYLQKEDLSKIRHKKNGGRRMIFAYVSLGEAENYRPYWKSEWSTKMPEWIDSENAQWKGNYKVKYWTDEWKKILYGTNNSCIDKAMNAGFDGVFLDVIDAYEYFENKIK